MSHEQKRSEIPNFGPPHPNFGLEKSPIRGSEGPSVDTATTAPQNVPSSASGNRNPSRAPSVSSHASVTSVQRRKNEVELKLAENVAFLEMEYEEELIIGESLETEIDRLTIQKDRTQKTLDALPWQNEAERNKEEEYLTTLTFDLDNKRVDLKAQQRLLERKAKALAREKNILEKRSAVEQSKIEEEDELNKFLDQDLSGLENGNDEQNRVHNWNTNPLVNEVPTVTAEDLAKAQEVEKCLEQQRLAKEDSEKNQREIQARQKKQEEVDAKQLELEVRLKNLMGGQTVNDVSIVTQPLHAVSTPAPVTIPSPSPTALAPPQSEFKQFMARQSHSKELPFFSGKAEEWLSFMCTYERTTELCGFSDSENLVRLQKCLKGDALKMVQCLMVSPENVPSILKTLKMRFGRPEHIIEALISKVRNVAPVKEDKLETVIDFGITVKNLTSTIEALKCNDHLSNPMLLKELETKLPANYRVQWMEWVHSYPERKRGLLQFAEWMDKKTEIMCDLCPPRYSEDDGKGQDGPRRNRRQGNLVLAVQDPTQDRIKKEEIPTEKKTDCCLFCGKRGHTLDVCRSFQREKIQTRWEKVKILKVCFLCLKIGHRTDNCQEKACGVGGCDRKHHPLLHETKRRAQQPVAAPQEPQEKPEVITNISHKGLLNKLLRIIPVLLRGPKKVVRTYAILDEGSTVTMVQKELAETLGLEGKSEPLCIQWFNGKDRQEEKSSKVSLEIAGNFYGSNYFKLENVRTISDLMIPPQTLDVEEVKKKWPHLSRMKLESMYQAKPTILIGIDNARLTVHKEILEGHRLAPIATRTRLGWALGGPHGSHSTNSEHVFHICEKQEPDIDLHRIMKDFFSTEAFGVKMSEKKLRSKQDERALALMEATTEKIGDRWETGLLWKSDVSALPESKDNAFHRLKCMERKMDRIPDFGRKYCSKLEDYEKKGYIRKLTEEEKTTGGPRTWYLPHFGVIHPNKPGKLRLVFDAAAKSGGMSLNDALLTGPDLLRPLPAVLWNFRMKPIAFTADIQEMFHQVKMKQDDQASLRFLWRGMSRDRPPDTYVMQVMIFGATSSPSSAIYVKDRNAQEWIEQFPEAVRAITMEHYMDDYTGNSDTVEEGSKLANEVIKVHSEGGFKIDKWVSNSKEFMKLIPEELRATGAKNFDNKAELPVERVLGLWWDAEKDVFTFKTNFHKVDKAILDGSKIPTKREMASLIMSLYDPLGFVAHFKVKGMMLLQEAWKSEIIWDDKIPEALYQRWVPWVEELKKIENVQIPRCYSHGLSTASNVQLHIFVDASEDAFAAVSYLRVGTTNGVEVTIVDSKVRVAPLKKLTIPRLELQAALMGSRMSETLKNSLNTRIDNVQFWSDSKTVLCWLRSEKINFRQFVAFRIGEILETTEASCWRWVPTALNVADDATRGNKPSDFSQESRWFNGPEFMKLPPENWPRENRKETEEGVTEEDLEVCHVISSIVMVEDPSLPDVTRFSSWTRLIRSTAMAIKAAKFWLQKTKKVHKSGSKHEITVDNMKEAEKMWWRKVQHDSFSSEIYNLQKEKPIDRDSRLRLLSPFLDEEGFLRVKGRIDAAPDLPVETKRPIILDPKHPYTKLLVDHSHREGAHQGQARVMNDLRQKFWILDVRAAVRASWSRCQECKNRKAKPIMPEMGALPISRLTSRRLPFNKTGVDYFGPMEVTIGRSRVKRWGVLFTCMATRAIHLEVSPSLDTDQMISALMRFINRRGRPEDMHSDNGTNFVGANSELKSSLEQMNQKEITTTMALKGIDWHFIPPAAPHMGGSWERMVQTVKRTLKNMLKETAPKEFTLLTFLTEVENIVNSRPLTEVSNDPADPEALTPNHFLRMGTDLGPSIPGRFDDKDLLLRKEWRKAQRMADHFWSRWLKEYLPSLIKRGKWHDNVNPIKKEDVVIIVDDQLPRNNWAKGIVVATFPGKDGIVRVVDVRTVTGVFRRSLAKVCRLDVHKEDKNPSCDLMGGRMSAPALTENGAP